MSLVGRRVNLKEVKQFTEILGRRYETLTYQLDDPMMEAELYSLGEEVRVLLPGTVKLNNHRASRINVTIDKFGMIKNIWNG